MELSENNQDHYKRKIKTREELLKILGPRPRQQRAIMCHGTFDLVHPGHIRHLMFAKSKADILIASLTSDAHINKADYRRRWPRIAATIRQRALAPGARSPRRQAGGRRPPRRCCRRGLG